MVRFLYNLLFPIAFVVLLPFWWVRMVRRGNWRQGFLQRFGVYSSAVYDRVRSLRRSWLHAVSVGEVLIALKVARAMRARNPEGGVVLSTTTSTGHALARREAPEWMEVIYSPVDFPWCVQEAFDLVRPERLVLIEAEMWPNLVAQAVRLGVPVALVNARLSPRSEARYRRFRWLLSGLFRSLDLVCVQNPADNARWTALGVPSIRVHCTGSIKFDPDTAPAPEVDPALRSVLERAGLRPGAPVLLAASTHPGEERILAAIASRLRQTAPGLLLVIAPRHVERVRGIIAELRAEGTTVSLRSDPAPADCLLLDTTGELRRWYPLATVVFIGKSLTGGGGQNPVEAVLSDVPVVCGPGMENFSAVVADLVRAGGIVQVGDASGLESELRALLGDPERRRLLPLRARVALEPHRGAADRTAELLLRRIGQGTVVPRG